MHIRDIFANYNPTVSLEFFPPKKEAAWTRLFDRIASVESLKPSFVSVTYGAGGTTRDKTHDLVVRLKDETKLDPVPHLTCVCHTAEEIDEILEAYASHGISNIMALGGDPPRDWKDEECRGSDFPHAADLVRHIVAFNSKGQHPDQRGFGIGVAGFPEGHPDTPNRLQELAYLKGKVDEGADYVCTQLFFDNRDFLDFRDRCSHVGIGVPVIAGLMPILSRQSFERIPDFAQGSRYPAKLLRQIDACESDDEIARVGMEWTVAQAQELLDEGVAGLHFYTLNRSKVTEELFTSLGLSDAAQTG